jgi:NTE family protein
LPATEEAIVKRALVLGGGGPVGIAWETALLAGLLEGGVDARKAALVVGTSAGSVVGTHLRHGRDPRELLEELRNREPRTSSGSQPDMTALTAVFAAWAAFDEMTPERCAEIGRMALEAKTAPEAQWVAAFAEYGWNGWPDKELLVTAVDCESGQLRAFDRANPSACSGGVVRRPASSAGDRGRRYTDGGVRSARRPTSRRPSAGWR